MWTVNNVVFPSFLPVLPYMTFLPCTLTPAASSCDFSAADLSSMRDEISLYQFVINCGSYGPTYILMDGSDHRSILRY